jgi:hypothetical protein
MRTYIACERCRWLVPEGAPHPHPLRLPPGGRPPDGSAGFRGGIDWGSGDFTIFFGSGTSSTSA